MFPYSICFCNLLQYLKSLTEWCDYHIHFSPSLKSLLCLLQAIVQLWYFITIHGQLCCLFVVCIIKITFCHMSCTSIIISWCCMPLLFITCIDTHFFHQCTWFTSSSTYFSIYNILFIQSPCLYNKWWDGTRMHQSQQKTGLKK